MTASRLAGLILALYCVLLSVFVNAEAPVDFYNPDFDASADCMEIPTSVCVGGIPVAVIDATPKGLVGSWNFDDAQSTDSSNNKNHARPVPRPGPGFGGVGSSAVFDGETGTVIQHSAQYETKDITYALWVFLTDNAVGAFRTLFHKGDENEQTITVLVWPETRRLHVMVSTRNGNVALESVAALPLHRWMHVSVVLEGHLLMIYVNGLLDASLILDSNNVFNNQPIYLAKDPWHLGLKCLIDSFQIYNRALNADEIMALGAPALEGISPGADIVHLGCQSCPFPQASAACKNGWHLCTKQEAFGFALGLARTQGWVNLQDDQVWFEGAGPAPAEASKVVPKGVGLCCKNN